ncbi:hypothetical protein [Pararhodobacter aggregans]|uniref:hypothetical protein n=1 Tax=Pararhodobacter aggregans TaxID=404875 RepID=UPI003A91EC7D
MLKGMLNVFGWFAIISAACNIAIRVAGSDEFLRTYAGASRNLNPGFALLAVGLIFLALAAIITRLDTLLAQREE